MRSPVPWTATLAFATVLLAGCDSAPETSASGGRFGSLALEACSTGEGAMRAEAMCGTLEVPEDRDAPDGRKIALNIAVLPARNDSGLEPVFFLAGGPGQAATTLAGHIGNALRDVRRSRDVVLVDQQYAMRYPDHVRTMVLDGVAPNDLVVGGEFARTFEDALALQAAQCNADAACRARFPVDAPTRLREVIAQLQAQPVEVEYRNATTGAIARDTVTADTVTGLAFLFSYAPETASLLPLMLEEASEGRYGALLALTRMTGQQFAGGMNRGMQWSVLCAEDAPRWNADSGSADGTILGAEVARMFFAACPAWPHGAADPAQAQPLESDIPTLLLSGELDPVTPPAYGERVAAGLANGRHLVLRGQGHGTLHLGCTPKLVAGFIEDADTASPDPACLDSLEGVPPFTSFNGWDP